MFALIVARIFFVTVCTATSFFLGGGESLFWGGVGFGISFFIVIFESLARKISLKGLSSTVFGVVLGLLVSWIFGEALSQLPLPLYVSPEIIHNIKIFATFVFVYLGLTLGIKGKDEFNLVIPYVKFKRQDLREEEIVVDTSSIIDGRILDIIKTKFVEARLVVPRFVLNELHTLADSTDHMKRQKGKRGIEILHSLKKEPNIEIKVLDKSMEGVKSVDEKIVKLAQELDSKVLTTDYNLNRIAQLQGVAVLNINDLANALKPSFVAGQRFSVKLIKEGKEHNQAIGYLEDGTMVVVEGARKLIGKAVDIEVTSILQSSSGRIVFTRIAK